MKGAINKGIQELVETKFGTEVWGKVKKQAKCNELFFSISKDYPDQMTLDLVSAASEVSDLSVETILFEFGKFWIPNTAADSYPTIFTLAGKTAREFLLSINKVHKLVTKNISNATPPYLETEELPDGRLLMHYQSERKLCAVVRGIILGVGAHFGEGLQVKETACTHKGANRCTMEVTFP